MSRDRSIQSIKDPYNFGDTTRSNNISKFDTSIFGPTKKESERSSFID